MNYVAMFLVVSGYFGVVLRPLSAIGYAVSLAGCLTYLCLFWGVDWSVVGVNAVFSAMNVLAIVKEMKEKN